MQTLAALRPTLVARAHLHREARLRAAPGCPSEAPGPGGRNAGWQPAFHPPGPGPSLGHTTLVAHRSGRRALQTQAALQTQSARVIIIFVGVIIICVRVMIIFVVVMIIFVGVMIVFVSVIIIVVGVMIMFVSVVVISVAGSALDPRWIRAESALDPPGSALDPRWIRAGSALDPRWLRARSALDPR